MISNGNLTNSNLNTFDYNDFRENPQPVFPYQYPSITNCYENYFHKTNYKCCGNYEQYNYSNSDEHFSEFFKNHQSGKADTSSLKVAEMLDNNLISGLKCLESLSTGHSGELDISSNSSGFVERFCEQYSNYDMDKQQLSDGINCKSDEGI